MAKKQSETEVLEQVKGTMECCICTERFTDPRMLPCMHMYCLECIQQTGLLSGKRPGDEMSCPVCRATFKVPLNGFIGLQKNFFIEKLMGILSKSEQAETFCGVCSGEVGEEAGGKLLASVYCTECWENLCEDCHKRHQSSKTFSNHRIVDVGSQGHREALLRSEDLAANYCGNHDNMRLNFFCFDCRQVSCKVCAAAEHSGHNCIHNVRAADQFENEIDDEVGELSAWAQKIVDKRQLLKQEAAALNENTEQIANGILDRHAKLKELLEMHVATLFDELNVIKEKKLQELENEVELLEGNLDVLTSFKTFCSNLKFSAQEGSHIVESIHHRASEMKKQNCGDISGQRLSLKHFDFKSALGENLNLIGKIENCAITVRGSLDVVDSSLYGIAIMQNNIYALSQFPHSILVFDDVAPFAFKQSISLINLLEPRDMAACQMANCLYVADTGNSSVWKVSAGDNHDVNCWLAEERHIASLSVITRGQVAVVRKGQKCTLTVYGVDASVIHCVSLSGELSNALHAVQKSNGNFVVSFGAGLKFGICEITKCGTVVRRLNMDDEFQRVKYPCHLTCGFDDRILVADFYNGRVVVLDSELEFFLEIISSKHMELSYPWRLCYNVSCKKLVVVHGGSKVGCRRTKIVVFEVG